MDSVLERFYIGEIGISRVSLDNILEIVDGFIINNTNGYICVSNSRTSYLANQDKEYCKIQNNSLLTVPDGTPLVWIAHRYGLYDVGKCSGIDIMEKIFEISVEKGYSHFFYGCSSKTIKLMCKNISTKYPGIDIRAAISPPFQPLESYDIDSLADDINDKSPTFFWCGLGAPKQERLIALLQPKLNPVICVGVGLAFEYYAETVRRAPKVFQENGLEWLFRSVQQPKKIRRFIGPFFWIISQLFLNKKK